MNQITRSIAIEILCRRLDISSGRLTGLAQRCAEAGLLPRAVGRDIPTLCSLELARLFLCATADNGLGHAAATVTTFESLTTETGLSLGDVLPGIYRGDTDAVGDAAFQLEPASAMLTIGNTKLFFGAALQGGVARITHIPSQIMKAITYEFSGHSQEEADKLTFQSTKDELQRARSRQAHLEGELRQIETALGPLSGASEEQRIAHRARGVELRDDLAAIDRRIAELEPQLAALAATRKAEATKRVPSVKAALDRLGAALDAVTEAGAAVEQQRVSLREAGGPSFKQLPQLTLPGCKVLVQRALVELEGAK